MRIIGGHTDYYDFAGGGFDDSVTYDRRGLLSDSFADALGMPEALIVETVLCRTAVSAAPFFAIVGGFGFPGVRVSAHHDYGDERGYHYDPEEAERALMAAIAEELPDAGRFVLREAQAAVSGFGDHLRRGPRDLTGFCAPRRLVTGVISRESPYGGRGSPPRTVYEPMRLLDLRLDTVLPAHEAHMLVSRFVGGVLTENPEGLEISDGSKIVKAGFDLKTSFRRPPQKA